MSDDGLRAHLEELKRKHRELDKQVEEVSRHRNADDEIRKLKTEKLWLKDEIHRIESQLETMETRINGHA
jgi:hypothetical protein|tara:strand:- start:2487 stop:2696 length:210 start_codon:yes stop_codon:yes gene_type:complete